LLQPRPGSVVVDCTLGGAGHARLLLEAIQPGGRLLAIDRDPAAVAGGRAQLSEFEPPATVVRGDFADLERIATEHGFVPADAVLFDFGLSSLQLDDPSRGFSFRQAGPLDMRMDPETPLTAAAVVNEMPERELADVIRRYGEERWALRIARFIVRRRPLATTADLAAAVEAAVPRGAWPRGIHVATRTFQAIRIAVNDELDSIERGLESALAILRPGGRVAAISFHSLEDRLVKSFFAGGEGVRAITRRPVQPSPAELERNPRARSARLRVAERV
jgi:16S rRNA (cytosine1402-N4)-methyltransferase